MGLLILGSRMVCILVGGGTGFVGRHLVKILRDTGSHVRIITRKPKNNTDYVSWDVIKHVGLPKETTAVINVSGRNILDPVPWTESFKKEVYSSRVDTNRLLADAIHKAKRKPTAFITISGVGYYAPSDSYEYDEQWTQPAGSKQGSAANYLMRLAADWERASELDATGSESTRRVIIRSGAVIGSDGGIVQNLKVPFNMSLGGPIGSGKQWFPWIHVDDLANMFKFALFNDNVQGVINGVAPEQLRNVDFANTFADLLNRPAMIPFPAFAVKLIFGSDRAVLLLDGMKVKSRAEAMGFKFEYPTLIEACKQSLRSEFDGKRS